MEDNKQSQTQELSLARPGRLIINYLQDNIHGATSTEIFQFLKNRVSNDSEKELQDLIDIVLVNGATLGFLERKGSRFINWVAREACCLRRRRRKSCRRRRKRRRRRRKRCRC